jgi:energy-converting hydrogenase Eha subunit B
MFASRTVVGHLMRGGIAAALIAWALQSADPAFAVAAIVLAVVAMRGCPLCWTLGLVETIANRLGRSGH